MRAGKRKKKEKRPVQAAMTASLNADVQAGSGLLKALNQEQAQVTGTGYR